MDFEIEFFPVGDASKAGDAIVARYGRNGQYSVTVIDGGTEDSGNAIVEHIKAVYGPTTVVDHVVSTHPDSDHASGLRTILREIPVSNLWIHGLWFHAAATRPLFADPRFAVESFQKKDQR
jgi:glyoxylase-like metal-dependent hydrolase (beta-lactamase superfamily II)